MSSDMKQLTEPLKTKEEITLDIEREKEKYGLLQYNPTKDTILNDLKEIFNIMFVWYIDNITFEYLYTDEINRKERYEKKKVEKGGKIKFVKTKIKKSFDKNLNELELDVQKFVNMFENKSELFSSVNYDESWYDYDPQKKDPPPTNAKELYIEENIKSMIKELRATKTEQEQQDLRKYIETMKEKLKERWTHLDQSNKEIYKKQYIIKKEELENIYRESKKTYLENKKIEMSFVPYYYRYFIIIFQQIYSKYFTYNYINSGKNTNIFISVIIVIIGSMKNTLQNIYNIKDISEIIKLLYGFMYKITQINEEQNKRFEEMVLHTISGIRHIKGLINDIRKEKERTGKLSVEKEEQIEQLISDLEKNNDKLTFLNDYNQSSNILTRLALHGSRAEGAGIEGDSNNIEGLSGLFEKYKLIYIELESVNIPPNVGVSEFHMKLTETIETILFFFQTFLKENDISSYSFYRYVTNVYENIYLVGKDLKSFPSLKKDFDEYNVREKSKSIDAVAKAEKAKAINFEALKKVEKEKKCEICGKIGKINFSKAQWGKPITENRKCKECVVKEKEALGKKTTESMAAAAEEVYAELIGEEEKEKQREREKAKQKAEKSTAAAEQTSAQATIAVDMKGKKILYETSIGEIDELLDVINKLKYDVPDTKMFNTAQRENAEAMFKDITKILNDNGIGKLVMVGNFSIYKLMEHVIGTDLSKIGIATDDIDGKICLQPTDESLDLIRGHIVELLNKEKIVVKSEENRDGNDPNTPIKILSSVEEKQLPGMRPIPNRPIIDITFDIDSNDKRCETQLLIDDMFISDTQSTLLHYLDIFSSLKKDDNTYNDEMIKEISKEVKLKSKRGYEYTIPLWKSLINKAKQEDGFYERKGFSINKEMFPSFLRKEGIMREALQEFIAKLATFEYKIPSWKSSLERLKIVFEKLLTDVNGGESHRAGAVSQGGRRKTRKKNKIQRRTRKRSKIKKNIRKTINHWKRKTLKRKKINQKNKRKTLTKTLTKK